MNKKDNYDFTSFKQLFHEIAFDYEPQYGPYIHDDHVTFYKTTIYKDGRVSRKGNYYSFNPKSLIWEKTVTLAKLLVDNPTEKLLYEEAE